MINFFRRIRQSLLSEGKTGKYLKYALGEIFLVVIGILIALSINNWNQKRKEKNIEDQYVKNIIRDLKEQLSSIEIQLSKEKSYYEAASYLIEDFNKDQTFTIDSIFFKNATILANRKTFVIIDPTYTDLVSSGNISIIKSQFKKDILLDYYQELERIEKIIQNNNSLLIDQHYMKGFLKNGYYYENLYDIYEIKSLAKFPGKVILPNYEPILESISKNIILKDENKLEFLNVINLRQAIALGNYYDLQVVTANTQSLIEELNQ